MGLDSEALKYIGYALLITLFFLWLSIGEAEDDHTNGK